MLLNAPFQSLKVLELASVLAGPSVGQFFAELGAEVIKVENPLKGDVTRGWKLPNESNETDISAYFSCVNWGKKSIALDLSKKEGLDIFYELVKKTDIVIASFKPGDAEKLKVDYDLLSSLNSKLIYGHITGYGNENKKVGYDAIIQAEAGFMSMNGEKERGPIKMPVALIDLLAGHQLKEGLLIALYKRLNTGKGSYVEVSLFDSAVASLANQATNFLMIGEVAQRIGSDHPTIVPYGTIFKTADDQEILLAIGNDSQFATFCQIIEADFLLLDERYITNHARVKNKESLLSILKQKIANHTREELLKKLESACVPVGSINKIDEVLQQEQTQDWILSAESIKGMRSCIAYFDRKPLNSSLMPPPHIGEHTIDILTELGIESEIINSFYINHIIK